MLRFYKDREHRERAREEEKEDPPEIDAARRSAAQHAPLPEEDTPEFRCQRDDLLVHVAPGDAFLPKGKKAESGVDNEEQAGRQKRGGKRPSRPEERGTRLLKGTVHSSAPSTVWVSR